MRLFGKKHKKKEEPKMAKMVIYNPDDYYEFGECSACGKEIDPTKCNDSGVNEYPKECPECRSKFDRWMIAEEED